MPLHVATRGNSAPAFPSGEVKQPGNQVMASLPIFDRTGKEVGKYEIDPSEIAPRISKQLLHDVVVMYQCNLRQGTVRTKTRSEVAGSTKKMYRQKGTGNARAGSRSSG